VIGGGQMGLLTAQAAVARGASVTVAEPLEGRRALARALGARAAEPRVEDVGTPNAIMLATGAAPAWELALACADRGAVVQLFAPSGPEQARSFVVDEVFFKELEIQASYSAGPRDTRAALALIASGAVTPEKLITHRFGLEDTGAALAMARSREGVKVIVTNA
jgi:L-iditol 2-dehydrogenase